MRTILSSALSRIANLLLNLLLVYVVYMLCRVVFVWENWHLYASDWNTLNLRELLIGSLRFDTSAICYTNSLYGILALLPFVSKRGWQRFLKWLFVITNSLAVIANLIDTVYSQYTGRRTTSTVFREFQDENNLGSIFSVELLHHWYLVLIGAMLIALLWFLYRPHKPTHQQPNDRTSHILNFTISLVSIVLFATLSVIGIRGGASTAIRPITLSNANQYVRQPSQCAIVLNTPFSMIRSLGKNVFSDPHYYSNTTLDTLYSPLHQPADTAFLTPPPNIVILIVESFGSEYIDEGYAPFTDSLLRNSLTFSQSYSNGRKSIDAMPSILSSIPMFIEPFVLTPASLNNISSVASCVKTVGYHTVFFHGAENSSMGFQAFARSVGFDQYYGRTEYLQDPRFNGDDDFDGTWAIWDEPFLQYFATILDTLPQPFLGAVFTASSHHPFAIPKHYQGRFPKGTLPIHPCIGYTDNALRRFFATISQTSWYNNTIFVLTADHTNMQHSNRYPEQQSTYRIPIAFFDPSHRLPRGVQQSIAQQIDIMPTLLSIIGYRNPYIAFGIDLISTPPADTWAANYSNGVYQYYHNDHIIQFDGTRPLAAYTLQQQHDSTIATPTNVPLDEDYTQLKALIQSYMQRMTQNRLLPEKK